MPLVNFKNYDKNELSKNQLIGSSLKCLVKFLTGIFISGLSGQDLKAKMEFLRLTPLRKQLKALVGFSLSYLGFKILKQKTN